MMNTILMIISLVVGVLLGRRTNKKALIIPKSDFKKIYAKLMEDENTHVFLDNEGFGTTSKIKE